MKRLTSRLPYTGLITSRYENQVTLDLGKNTGASVGQLLPVYRIARVVKHPYMGTIMSVEREQIGTIKILNIDKWISFAVVTEESKDYKFYLIIK